MHVYGTRPRTRTVNTAVSIGSTRPFTGRVLYTGRKHGRVQGTRSCTRPCSGHGRTMHGRVHGTYTAVHRGRKDGRVDSRIHGTRPVHGHVYGTYTVGYGPRTRPCFATYRLRTRPCSGNERTMCMARVWPCTQFVHGRGWRCTVMHGPCTWSVRDRVHGRVYGRKHGRVQSTRPCRCTLYTDVGRGRVYGPCAWRCTYCVYGRVHSRSRRVRTVYTGVQGPCTWCVHGHVQVHLHGRVLCTRPCLRPVYTAAHGSWSVRDPITAVYAARTRPFTVNTAVFTARDHGIVRTVNRVHAVSINETKFAQHKPSTIFMSRSS